MTEYYTMSTCTPARASLMTGRYAVRYGLQYSVIDPGAPWGLPLTEKVRKRGEGGRFGGRIEGEAWGGEAPPAETLEMHLMVFYLLLG